MKFEILGHDPCDNFKMTYVLYEIDDSRWLNTMRFVSEHNTEEECIESAKKYKELKEKISNYHKEFEL